MTSERKLPPPDDYDPVAPLTDEEIKRLRPASELFAEYGIPVPVPRGRPKAETTKRSVTIRLDEEVIDFFKADGSGWQTRINDALAKIVHKKSA